MMAKNQRDYFEIKHPWSLTKDDLLSCYLTPYFQKVYRFSHDGIVYVDAFAGEGKFEDGQYGSPLIALSKVLSVARKQTAKNPVQFILAEANDASRDKLEDCIRKARGKSRYIKEPIILADHVEALNQAEKICVCGSRRPSTVFYYVDPFGVKDLRLDLLLRSPNPNHTEVLLNFSSIGFLRDACAALSVDFASPQNVKIYDDGFEDGIRHDERQNRLTRCIGSEDWMDVIERFKEERIDFWQAEYEISKILCRNAARAYNYVTNMPIKDMTQKVNNGGLLKYRMIHMTNNEDGCVLMNDNMLKRNDLFQLTQPGLFKVDVDGKDVKPDIIAARLNDAVAELSIGEHIKMGALAAAVISGCGVFDKVSALLKTYLGPLLDDGILERVVKYTRTGKPKHSFAASDIVYRVK